MDTINSTEQTSQNLSETKRMISAYKLLKKSVRDEIATTAVAIETKEVREYYRSKTVTASSVKP